MKLCHFQLADSEKMLMRLALEGIQKVAAWMCNVTPNVVSSYNIKKIVG